MSAPAFFTRSNLIQSVMTLAIMVLCTTSTSRLAVAKQQGRLGAPSAPSIASPPSQSADPAYEAFQKGEYLRALKLAMAQSKKGELQAFTLVGRIYASGLGVPKDLTTAAQWYAGGAERGDRDSQFALAMQLARGLGVKRDIKQAANLFEAAAEQGHGLAQYNYGLIYVAGTGRPIDMTKAAIWFEKAALQNQTQAQYDLGSLYRAGAGVKQDVNKAAYWMGQAASSGLAAAELEYGLMLYLGKGVAQDQKSAASFILKAAQKGNPVAQNRIAKFYAHGLVFQKDPVESGKWHLLARKRGMSDIRLDLRFARLPKEQRQLAETKAQIWRRQNQLP